MKIGVLKRTPVLIAVGVIGLVCLMQVLRHDFLERLERMTYDWRVRQAVRFSPTVSTNLGFVHISDESITAVNQGLLKYSYGLYWPRHIYGAAVRELSREGAKAVAFDILFAGLRPDHAAVPMSDNSALHPDNYFAVELKKAGNVIIASEHGAMPASLFRTNAHALGDISADKDPDGILRHAQAFKMYKKWHPAFLKVESDPEYGIDLDNAEVQSNRIILQRKPDDPIVFPLDKDGNFDLADFIGTNIPPGMQRHAKPFTEYPVWHMGIVLAAQQLKLDLEHPIVELGKGRITLMGPNGMRRVIPVDKNGYFYIDWCLPANGDKRLTEEGIERVLARDEAQLTGDTNHFAGYLTSKVDWRDKLILVGSSATGNDLTDRGATPLSNNTLLVSEHWNVANSILMGRFIRRSSLPMELLLIVLMGALAAWLTWACRSYIASIWVLASLVVYALITVFAFVVFRYWMPLVLPLAGGLVTTHFCLLGYLVIFEQAERRRVRSIFTKLVSPDVVTEVLNKDLALDGTQRNVTVFFSDIRGFTELTDVNRAKAEEYIAEHKLVDAAADEVRNKEAKETLQTVNQYLEIIANMVKNNGGTVDKFIGDCVMAFWGAPVANPRHALHCVRAAIDTQRAIYKFNQERETTNRLRDGENLMLAAYGKPLQPLLPVLVVGTGINTGVVTVGLMGSDERVNYTVFGREVNLASRLETYSGRARIIISEATLAEIIQDDPTLALTCKSLEPIKVKGIRDAVRIYEVPWREGEAVNEQIQQASTTQVYNTGYFTAVERTD